MALQDGTGGGGGGERTGGTSATEPGKILNPIQGAEEDQSMMVRKFTKCKK